MAVLTAGADDYYALLLALRPAGPAWPTDDAQLQALGDGLSRAHARALGLLVEADPRSTAEMLVAWERNAGLPDECTGPAETVDARRLRLVQQLTARGGASRAFFIGLAEALGFAGARITEYRPYTVGSACESALTQDQWQHTWLLSVYDGGGVIAFTAGGGCTDALRVWGSSVLECVIRRAAPAHTVLTFGYMGHDWMDGGDSEDWGELVDGAVDAAEEDYGELT